MSFVEKPADPPAIPGKPDRAFASMGIYLFNADFLYKALIEDIRASDYDLIIMGALGIGAVKDSQLGSVTDTNASLYGLSKAALIYLTRAMAVELAGSGIIVNAVSPGTTATDFILQTVSGDRLTSRLRKIPAGRLGQPEEIAEVVAYLATSAPDFLVGHDLAVDGGETSA